VVYRKWRGIGEIPQSGLGLTPEYTDYDAELRFGVSSYTAQEDPECISGLVMQGARKPKECTAYGTRCTPGQRLGRRWFRPRELTQLITATDAYASLR